MTVFQKPKASSDAEIVKAPKPPADPNRPVRRPSSSRQRMLQQSVSMDASGGDAAVLSVRNRSGSLQDGMFGN